MPNIKYVLGELEIVRGRISQKVARAALGHRFVVEEEGDTTLIHVAYARNQTEIAAKLKLDESLLVGGGSIYVDDDMYLVLEGSSRFYKAIPIEAATAFGEKLLPKVKRFSGIEAKGVRANPVGDINPYWVRNGFDRAHKRGRAGSYDIRNENTL